MNRLTASLLLLLSTPAFAEPNCTDQVNAAFQKLRTRGSFRMETKVVDPKQGTLHLQVDYVLPDRMDQKVSLGSDGMTMDTIAIGEEAWSNQGDGWRKLPDAVAKAIAQEIKETVAETPKGVTEFKCLGETNFEGKNFRLYQGALEPPQGIGKTASSATVSGLQNVYVDETTGFPVRNVVTSSSDPSVRLFDGTFRLIDSIKIEAPRDAN